MRNVNHVFVWLPNTRARTHTVRSLEAAERITFTRLQIAAGTHSASKLRKTEERADDELCARHLRYLQ